MVPKGVQQFPGVWVELNCLLPIELVIFKVSPCHLLPPPPLWVECLIRDRGPRVRASPVSLRCDTSVLVQPRKTRLCLTERLFMGRKESNQTNKRLARRTVDSKIDENRCKQKYELIQVMCILYRYISLTASNCSISLTVIYPFQWKKYNVV